MKRLVVTGNSRNTLFNLMDPDEPLEKEFENEVICALPLAFPGYKCFKFNGTFELDGHRSQPDLALLAGDFSHWFVVEVELLSHSLHRHVLPQVKTLQYGEPQEDCVLSLAKSLGLPADQVRTLVRYLPRHVAVVANRPSADWELALRVVEVQMLSVHVFESEPSHRAYVVDGALLVSVEHLGFGCYSAADKSVRFANRITRLPDGPVQIEDSGGGISTWLVQKTVNAVWVTKVRGNPSPAFQDGVHVQLVQASSGRLVFRHDPATARFGSP